MHISSQLPVPSTSAFIAQQMVSSTCVIKNHGMPSKCALTLQFPVSNACEIIPHIYSVQHLNTSFLHIRPAVKLSVLLFCIYSPLAYPLHPSTYYSILQFFCFVCYIPNLYHSGRSTLLLVTKQCKCFVKFSSTTY